VSHDGFTDWCRWVDDRVGRTPWPVAVGLWVGVIYLAIKLSL